MIEFFTKKFESADFIYKSKAKIFFYYSCFMLLLLTMLLILYAIMPISDALAKKGMIGGFGIMFLVFVSLFLLRTGNLDIAVWSYALPTILITIALRLINSRSAPETSFSTYIFYMPYLIVYVAVFGKRYQVLLTTFLFVTTNWIVWAMVRSISGEIGATISTGIINSSMGLLTTGVLSYSLMNIIDKYTLTLMLDAKESAHKVERIRGALEVAHDALHVGSTLISESEAMESVAGSIGRGIDEIRLDVLSLQENVSKTSQSNEGIVESTATLARSTEKYQAMTLQASSAVEQMTASIGSITNVSTKNRNNVESLARSISEGIETADSSAATIASLIESSSALQDIVEVISAISNQTNLLAMNAAIEAAHAGDSGKGFAVVAEEIRRLAEETASNSHTISDGLGQLFNEIGEAKTANQRIDAAFKQIGSEIERTRTAFDEILTGMNELSIGTTDINRAVSDVVSSSREMTGSIKVINDRIGSNAHAIADIREKTQKTLSSLESLQQHFSSIVKRSETVRSLGHESETVIRGLDDSLRAI
jgi:methyl-accepting chemotaxis protein